MTLALYVDPIQRLARLMRQLGDTGRFIRDSTGDLPLQSIVGFQDALMQAAEAAREVRTEASRAPDAAGAYMAQIGGPATLADYDARLGVIDTAAKSWGSAVMAWFNGLPVTVAFQAAPHGVGDDRTLIIQRTFSVPADLAEPIRQSAELAALIAALESAGAV